MNVRKKEKKREIYQSAKMKKDILTINLSNVKSYSIIF